jgi:curved DNA-binding protein CbpA
MTTVEEQTLYDVLEVEPRASLEEIRAAHARAAEAFGPDSIAVYALVDDAQVEALRERLAEAAEVLLDPARRASYDRSIGLQGPGMLWEEDEDDDEEELPPSESGAEEPVGPGPHPLAAEAALEGETAEEPPPAQRDLDLELGSGEGPFGRALPEPQRTAAPEPAPDSVAAPAESPAVEAEASAPPALQGDWAEAVIEAVPPPTPEPEPAPAPVVAAPPSRSPPPLPRSSLGLRRPAGAEARASAATVGSGEGTGHPVRTRLDIPPEAEFNGELLRQVRESYGLSLQQVAERTRITRIHLENVEADRYEHLPATVYLRGILVNLARELRLDPARVSKSYLLVAQRAQTRGP